MVGELSLVARRDALESDGARVGLESRRTGGGGGVWDWEGTIEGRVIVEVEGNKLDEDGANVWPLLGANVVAGNENDPVRVVGAEGVADAGSCGVWKVDGPAWCGTKEGAEEEGQAVAMLF